MSDRVYDEPSKVDTEQGQVMVSGPDGVAVTLTPEAALETSDRLLEAAAKATGQILEQKRQAAERAALGLPPHEPGADPE